MHLVVSLGKALLLEFTLITPERSVQYYWQTHKIICCMYNATLLLLNYLISDVSVSLPVMHGYWLLHQLRIFSSKKD